LCTKNYENPSIFVKVTAKKSVAPFFPGHGVVILASNISRNSDGATPCGGTKYRWGIKISRFSINKLLYLADDTR